MSKLILNQVLVIRLNLAHYFYINSGTTLKSDENGNLSFLIDRYIVGPYFMKHFFNVRKFNIKQVLDVRLKLTHYFLIFQNYLLR